MNRVLIIDGDKEILSSLAIFLEMKDFEVETIYHWDVFIGRVAAFKPDIILLDVYEAGIHGNSLCKQLRGSTETKHIPILLLSTHLNIKQLSLDCEANDFISKPFDLNDLLDRVNKLLKQSSQKTSSV